MTKKYRWGGADGEKKPYFDETARRMMYSMRLSMIDLAETLDYEGVEKAATDPKAAKESFEKALKVLDLAFAKQPESVAPWSMSVKLTAGNLYCMLGGKEQLNRPALTKKGLAMLEDLLVQAAPSARYALMMNDSFGNHSLTYESQYAPYLY